MTSPVRDRAVSKTPVVLVALAGLPLLAALMGASCQGSSTINNNPGAGGSDPGGVGGDDGSGTGGDSGGTGGSTGTAGMGMGGAKGTGGKTGTGGMGTGGRAAGLGGVTGAGGTVITVPASCGSTTHNLNPFGCNLAWGTNSPGGSLNNYSYLQFMSFWIGSEARSDGTLSGCSGCTWISNQVSKVSNIIPVFYAYIIGFYGHANGLPDGNQAPNGPNLTTGGANLIRNNRAKIISMYSSYASQVHAVWGAKPLVWLLEGDFVQYTTSTQANPLSYGELAQLAEDITCAIKAAMPNAVVAINHSTWNANDVTRNFWLAMSGVNYDMAWTSGAGNANDFFTPGTTATSYNGTTATYAYLHNITGRTILVDTSFGASATSDSWSDSGVANLNARITDGVIAINVTTPTSNYSSNIASEAGVTTTCH
jgi:hypothetical protein